MRNIVRTIVAGGPPAILAAYGAFEVITHEIHYLLRPSVWETVTGAVGVGGAIVWSLRNKGKKGTAETPPQPVAEEPRIVEMPRYVEKTLPRSQSNTQAQWNQQGASFRRIG